MSEETTPDELKIKRIIVAIDASTDSMAALRSVAAMASALEAELVGLFVEDENLFRLAELPFAVEMQRATGRVRPINPPDIEHDLILQASRARRALREIARQAEARWRFEVVRGVVAQEILKASMEADLLSLGRTSRPLFRRMQLGSTAREAIGRSAPPVFLARSGPENGGPIHVIYDGSPAGDRALVIAAYVAGLNEAPLTVLLPPAERMDADTTVALADQAEVVLSRLKDMPELDFQELPAGEKELREKIQEAACSLLVINSTTPLVDTNLEDLLAALTCPVIVIR